MDVDRGLILGIAPRVRGVGGSVTRRDISHDAPRILEEWFPRGEIVADEFQRRLQVLRARDSCRERLETTGA
jgi:uncharacterized membrane protein